MNTGIDTTALSDNDADISKAALAKDLFKATNEQDKTLDVSDLFISNNTQNETEVKTDDLFKSQISLSTDTSLYNLEQHQTNTSLVIVISALIVIGYLIYLIQKSKMKKELVSIKAQMNTI